MGIGTWLEDQSFGMGTFIIQRRDKAASWVSLQDNPDGPGGTNRVALPGPDGDCVLDPNPESNKVKIAMMFMRDQDCGDAGPVPICITGYQAWAAFDNNKGGSSGDMVESGLSIPLADDARTIVPMARRFEIFQQGTDLLNGTLSFGELVLCPEGDISAACAAEFLP